MKSALVLSLLLAASHAHAANYLQKCTVTKVVDPSILEESLSESEYPYVTVEDEEGSLVITLGANRFENNSEFATEAMPILNSDGFSYRARGLLEKVDYTVSGETYFVDGKSTKSGSVYYTDRENGFTLKLAELDCKTALTQPKSILVPKGPL